MRWWKIAVWVGVILVTDSVGLKELFEKLYISKFIELYSRNLPDTYYFPIIKKINIRKCDALCILVQK